MCKTTVFILDKYNKYQLNEDCRFIFTVNDRTYCVREVQLEWGNPVFEEKEWDDESSCWKIFDTLDDAIAAARAFKKFNT